MSATNDASAENTNGTKSGMPQGDVDFLVACLQNTTGGSISIDTKAVAEALGYQNHRSVGNKILTLKKKYDLPFGSSAKAAGGEGATPKAAKTIGEATPKAPKTPKTPKSTKKVEPVADGDTEEAEPTTPTAKAPKRKAPSKKDAPAKKRTPAKPKKEVKKEVKAEASGNEAEKDVDEEMMEMADKATKEPMEEPITSEDDGKGSGTEDAEA